MLLVRARREYLRHFRREPDLGSAASLLQVESELLLECRRREREDHRTHPVFFQPPRGDRCGARHCDCCWRTSRDRCHHDARDLCRSVTNGPLIFRDDRSLHANDFWNVPLCSHHHSSPTVDVLQCADCHGTIQTEGLRSHLIAREGFACHVPIYESRAGILSLSHPEDSPPAMGTILDRPTPDGHRALFDLDQFVHETRNQNRLDLFLHGGRDQNCEVAAGRHDHIVVWGRTVLWAGSAKSRLPSSAA